MTTFLVGTLTRRPSASRPDLMAMLSSCAPRVQLRMTMPRVHSGSQPSVLECAVLGSVLTPSTMTLVHSVGCNCQNCGFFSVTPEMSTRSQLYGSTNVERMLCPMALRLCGSVTPCEMSCSRNARLEPLFQLDVPPASSVPLPV